ncbi:hypothetical protein F5146DRAFT_1121955 [Armillaria mellea]|nr:hypothetical protein F5146DRAFT_1121955 [Armillaria mellea]
MNEKESYILRRVVRAMRSNRSSAEENVHEKLSSRPGYDISRLHSMKTAPIPIDKEATVEHGEFRVCVMRPHAVSLVYMLKNLARSLARWLLEPEAQVPTQQCTDRSKTNGNHTQQESGCTKPTSLGNMDGFIPVFDSDGVLQGTSNGASTSEFIKITGILGNLEERMIKGKRRNRIRSRDAWLRFILNACVFCPNACVISSKALVSFYNACVPTCEINARNAHYPHAPNAPKRKNASRKREILPARDRPPNVRRKALKLRFAGQDHLICLPDRIPGAMVYIINALNSCAQIAYTNYPANRPVFGPADGMNCDAPAKKSIALYRTAELPVNEHLYLTLDDSRKIPPYTDLPYFRDPPFTRLSTVDPLRRNACGV